MLTNYGTFLCFFVQRALPAPIGPDFFGTLWGSHSDVCFLACLSAVLVRYVSRCSSSASGWHAQRRPRPTQGTSYCTTAANECVSEFMVRRGRQGRLDGDLVLKAHTPSSAIKKNFEMCSPAGGLVFFLISSFYIEVVLFIALWQYLAFMRVQWIYYGL